MIERTRLVGAFALLGAALQLSVGAQTQPVGAMFADDQKRERSLALSFATEDVPPAASGGAPLRVYLTVGDLERAFDSAQYRPDAAIIPTNTDLVLGAASPATQRVLIDRVRKRAEVMRDFEEQAAARRKELVAGPGREAGKMQIGSDTFVAALPRGAGAQASRGSFPKSVCMVATDFPVGGAVDRRELFAQDRVRKGIAGCLTALDAAGAQSVVMPLMGASSANEQSRDPVFEGQRLLKECRLINSVAGLALGVHDFAAGRRQLRELGIVQWDREVTDMFDLPTSSQLAQAAYKIYAGQITAAWRKGLAGEKTTPADVGGNCAATFNAQ